MFRLFRSKKQKDEKKVQGGAPSAPSEEELAVKNLSLAQKLKLVTGKDFWTTQDYLEEGIPSVRFSDGPHGLRAQAGASDNFGLENSVPATCFPCLSALASSWDRRLLRETGARLGEEAATLGVNVLLGPGVNIKRNPLCGRNFEYLSEEPYLAGELAANYIRGVQGTGVACCVKHFACNNREFARTVYSSEPSERALREIYLTPFEMAVKRGGVAAVMTAYNKLNGTYCSENERLISGILRGEWGFDGIVISDWVGTSDRAAGVRAGEDLEMPRCVLTPEELQSAIKEDTLSEEDIDRCAVRIARFAKKYSRPARGAYDGEEHLEFARRASEECVVLLKNEGALPLSAGEKVLIIGELAAKPHLQGGGSARVNARNADDIINCLSVEFGTDYVRGCRRDGRADKKLKRQAIERAKPAQKVIFFAGLTEREDAEGADRESMEIPLCQRELLEGLHKEGVRPIVVLFSGSAVCCDWEKYASAILYMPLTGAGTGMALANLLAGKVCPSGKLSETFPADYSDVPSSQSFAKDPYICRYEEDILVGYRWYDAANIAVKYPFGYGLSYTKFSYSDLKCSEDRVTFRLKNTGACAGAETAQVYICPQFGGLQPVKKLAGFEKVFLQPDEERTVEIKLDEYALHTFDEKSCNFAIYAGQYGVIVGSSSRDTRLWGSVKIKGIRPPEGADGAALRADLVRGVLAEKSAAEDGEEAAAECGRKTRVEITLKSPLIDLKNAKGAWGRLIYRIADFYCTSKKQTALLTFRYITVRSAMQYAGFNRAQAQGFIDICNGSFFKGLKKIITKRQKGDNQ